MHIINRGCTAGVMHVITEVSLVSGESIVTMAKSTWGFAKGICFVSVKGKTSMFDDPLCSFGHLPLVLQVPCSPAIAGNGEVAGLGVQGEQLQVHRAAQG